MSETNTVQSKTEYLHQYEMAGGWFDHCHGHPTMLEAIECLEKACEASRDIIPQYIVDMANEIAKKLGKKDGKPLRAEIPSLRLIKRTVTEEVLEVRDPEVIRGSSD